MSERPTPYIFVFLIGKKRKISYCINMTVRVSWHLLGTESSKNYSWTYFMILQKSFGFKLVFISHLEGRRTTTGTPMGICLVDKKSYPMDSSPQASAKCNFKVGHVNQREWSTTIGSQICCRAVSREGAGGRAALMTDIKLKNQSRGWFSLSLSYRLASRLPTAASHAVGRLCWSLKMVPYMAASKPEKSYVSLGLVSTGLESFNSMNIKCGG